jgi:hypothetical protein
LLAEALGSFEKLKCKNFSILKFYDLSKTQNFQNSLKIRVFITYRNLHPKKKQQFKQRIAKKHLAGIGEPMVPTFGGLANIDTFLI